MATISPFRGIYYNKDMFPCLEYLVAPPYDVVDEREREAIVKRNPKNIFSLELPSMDDCSEPVGDKYECAAFKLNRWLREKVLLRDERASIYPYDIEYMYGGGKRVRRGFISLVRADGWDKRTVLPHERTFAKVTEDRFLLRSATRAQFSQIFMIYRHQDEVSKYISEACREKLIETTDALGALHSLSRIIDDTALHYLRQAFESIQLYIADGHHRYTTAIRYRKEMEARFGLGPQAQYNFTMAYIVDAADPGLVVLPTHRLLNLPAGMGEDEAKRRLSLYFDMNPIELPHTPRPGEHAETFRDVTANTCPQGISIMFGLGREAFVLCPKPEAKQRLMDAVGHRELADLDVVVLEELVFKAALGIDSERLEAGRDIFFVPDSRKALETLSSHQVLFFMHPTRVEQVLDVADAGLSMPHKSTYFFPKILTGMVISREDF